MGPDLRENRMPEKKLNFLCFFKGFVFLRFVRLLLFFLGLIRISSADWWCTWSVMCWWPSYPCVRIPDCCNYLGHPGRCCFSSNSSCGGLTVSLHARLLFFAVDKFLTKKKVSFFFFFFFFFLCPFRKETTEPRRRPVCVSVRRSFFKRKCIKLYLHRWLSTYSIRIQMERREK